MGKNLNQSSMRFLIVAALCAIASAAPEGRRLRPEEHWRPAQGRDLSKYKPRAAMVDANGDDLMEKINRVAAEMRASASPSNGDSGGPLVQKAGAKAAGDKWTQVGIVSFGSSSGCETGLPAGFTRTEYYLDWIKSETGMP